jgi:hypothetical protein
VSEQNGSEPWTEVYELWTHIDSDQTIDVREVWPEFAAAMDRVVDHYVQ